MAEMSFGKKLRALRKARGISQEKLARSIDVTSQSISRLEREEMGYSADTLMKLCKFFGIEDPRTLTEDDALPSVKHVELSREEFMNLLDELRASPLERAELGRFRESPEGRFQPFDRRYLTRLLNALRDARAKGIQGSGAIVESVLEQMENEVAAQEALDAGAHIDSGSRKKAPL